MDNLKVYNQRIINKILLNKLSDKNSTYKKFKIDFVTLQINYRKKKKELYQVYELISILEQLSGEKGLLKLNESTEKNNVIKLEDGRISVRLRKKKAHFFINNFIYLALGQRNHFTISEKNVMDIEKQLISFRYKNLKLFRNYLVRNYMNLEAKIKIDIKYKAVGYNNNGLTNYKFFIGRRNEYRIN
jgi:hypothetical protein